MWQSKAKPSRSADSRHIDMFRQVDFDVDKISVIPFFDKDFLAQRNDFRVDFDESQYNRKKSANPEFESEIDRIWNEKKKVGNRIYNASKFRFSGFATPKTAGGEIELRIGLTDYKDLLGTHYGAVEPEEGANVSNAVGVGAITVTNDGFVVLMQRSQWTGEQAGKVDRPGGHPEPDAVKTRTVSKLQWTPLNKPAKFRLNKRLGQLTGGFSCNAI